jgi:hypothetical protein
MWCSGRYGLSGSVQLSAVRKFVLPWNGRTNFVQIDHEKRVFSLGPALNAAIFWKMIEKNMNFTNARRKLLSNCDKMESLRVKGSKTVDFGPYLWQGSRKTQIWQQLRMRHRLPHASRANRRSTQSNVAAIGVSLFVHRQKIPSHKAPIPFKNV